MTGFFDIPKKAKQSGFTCVTCGLYKYAKSPRMELYGEFKRSVLVVGEAPGETEDVRGRPWQGKVGQLLQQTFGKLGYDLFEDCYCTNAVHCRPTRAGANRPPTAQEVLSCRPRVLKMIEDTSPHVVLLLGGPAVESVIGSRWHNDLGTISRWRGWTIPDRGLKAWLCSTFHPSFIARGDKEVETIWMQDLRRALDLIDVPLPTYEDEAKSIEIVDDLSFLHDLKGPVAFDYETTGLKPHDVSEHKIICASACNSYDKAFAFMMPEDDVQLRHWKKFLRNNEGKIAQNMKFEDTWTRNVLGYEVKNWTWDPMLAAHVLDNRPYVTGLKFQSYVQFGVNDYSSEVRPYLESKDKNANAVNRIGELVKTSGGKRKLLIYCGIDSLLEYRLALQQMKQLGDAR